MHTHDLEPLLRGHAELERTDRGWLPHRLPRAARAQFDDPQVATAEAQPSGVRLCLRTTATVIELDVLRTRVVLSGLPPRPDGTVDLVVDGHLVQQTTTSRGDTVLVDPRSGETRVERGDAVTIRFDGLSHRGKDVQIWLPHHERTELVALRTDAPAVPSPSDGRRTWLHHGSSISQGSNAASPSTTWPAIAATLGGLELINLGLAGSAMLDQFTARAIRDTTADVLSVKIGINLVNADVMRHRGFGAAVHGFLDTIRDGHPHVPLLVIGPLYCPIHETTSGPGAFDPEGFAAGQLRFIATGVPVDPGAPRSPLDRLTLVGIRERLADLVEARAEHDPNLSFLDGLDLDGPDDFTEHTLPDGLHPDATTHRLIGERFARVARSPGGLFAE